MKGRVRLRVELLLSESIHGGLKVSSMDGPQQDVDGVVELLPNHRFRHVHPLLHRPTRFEIRSFVIRHLIQKKKMNIQIDYIK